MSQVTVTVGVQYDPSSHGITFAGDPTHVTPLQDGDRAVIRVHRAPGQKEAKIVLDLSGEGAIFPAVNQAVEWTNSQPPWAQVARISDTEVQITDAWHPGEEPKDARFIIGVRDGSTIYKSQDPTIVNDPSNY